MLGVPVGDREQFKKWSDDFVRYIGGESTLAQEMEARRSLLELGAYFRQAIAGLRDGNEENLLSLAAPGGGGAGRPTERRGA